MLLAGNVQFTSRPTAEIVNVVKSENQQIRPTMSHLLATRPLQILAIDFMVLEPSKGKENV